MPLSEPLPSSRAGENPVDACRIVACVDRSAQAGWIVPHAFRVAEALDAPVTLFQVIEGKSPPDARPDPIEWDLRRHEARRVLGSLATAPDSSAPAAGVALAEGSTAEEICRFMSGQHGGLVVLGTHGHRDRPHGGIGGTAHNVLAQTSGSILLVPTEAGPVPRNYRRILVPMDGSCWAESVLPLATRLARFAGSELVLAHVVPSPELTETRPLEPEDLLLRQRVVERNEGAARTYLDRIRAYLATTGLSIRVVSTKGEDVRVALADLIEREAADLVVLSARGHGRGRHVDVRYGSVASYLMTHSAAPMLIVRSPPAQADATRNQDHHELRLPVACSA